MPVADAAGLRMARREGLQFGRLRGLSTIGYLMVILISGYLLRDLGIALFLPLFVGLGFIRAIAALSLPRLRAPDAAPVTTTSLWRGMKPWFVLTILGWAVVDSNHIILNSFQGVLWSQQGISTEVIGVLITLGALAETVMFFAFARVSARFAPRQLMIAAAGFSVIRWIGLALAPGPLLLIPLQLMHALTYAMGFLACTNFIADHTSEDNAAEAQSLLVMLELGVSAVVVLALMRTPWLTSSAKVQRAHGRWRIVDGRWRAMSSSSDLRLIGCVKTWPFVWMKPIAMARDYLSPRSSTSSMRQSKPKVRLLKSEARCLATPSAKQAPPPQPTTACCATTPRRWQMRWVE